MSGDDGEYETDEFLDGVLTDAESQQDLQRQVALGTSVAVEMTDPKSVLRVYMDNRRQVAMQAMAGLIDADPEDAMVVSGYQALVREYLNVRSWTRQRIDAADAASDTMQRDYGEITDETGRSSGRRAAAGRRRR